MVGGCVIHRRREGIAQPSAVEARCGLAGTLLPQHEGHSGASSRIASDAGKNKGGALVACSETGATRESCWERIPPPRAALAPGRRPHRGHITSNRRMSHSRRTRLSGGSTSTANLVGIAPFIGKVRQSNQSRGCSLGSHPFGRRVPTPPAVSERRQPLPSNLTDDEGDGGWRACGNDWLDGASSPEAAGGVPAVVRPTEGVLEIFCAKTSSRRTAWDTCTARGCGACPPLGAPRGQVSRLDGNCSGRM